MSKMKPQTKRCIAHVDIDAFFASVEQVLIPSLRGRPVAVGAGCIASCSYEARRRGLCAAMSLSKARKLCPELVIMPGSYGVYRCFAERVWELCREVSPSVETLLDDAYLDLSGTDQLYGDPRGPISALKRRIHEETGLTVSAGIGPNRIMARLAGKVQKPDGLTFVNDDEVEAFLVDLPVDAIPGIGPKTVKLLSRFNIATVRELRSLSRDAMEDLLGKVGVALYERARGRDTRVVSVREIPGTISRETTFHSETTDPGEVRSMLYYLVERAMKAVRELGIATRSVALRIRYADFKGDDGRRRLTEATDLEGPVYEAVMLLLAALHTRRVALRLVGVTLSGFVPGDDPQMDLFIEDEDEKQKRIAGALDEIRAKAGFSAITAGKSIGLLGKLKQDANGYVLRTPCLTK